MEIQGLTNAQNTHYQHGVPPQSDSTSPGTSGLVSDRLLHENCTGSTTDGNNNNKRASSSLLLLPQNGSGSLLQHKQTPGVLVNNAGLCHLNVLKDKEYVDLDLPTDFVKIKYGPEESEDAVLQMAVPLFDSDEEAYTSCEQSQGHITPPLNDKCTTMEENTHGAAEAESSKDIYVVFNVLQDDKCLLGDRGKDVNKQLGSNESTLRSATDFSNLRRSPDLTVSKIKCGSKSTRKFGVLTHSKPTGGGHEAEIRTESVEGIDSDGIDSDATCSLDSMEPDDVIKCRSIGRSTEATLSPEIPAKNSSECVNDTVNLSSNGTNNDSFSDVPPETFSGTIMINNQSIIVTIENGVLTLAAPPDNYTYKEDGVVSLKEHLGVKENEDIVLLNYESGAKSMGKMAEHERVGMDSEVLTLPEPCTLPAPGSSFESLKHEVGSPCDRKNQKDQPEDERHPAGPLSSTVTAKKSGTGSFRCSQPGCACVFDTRQKLKMHLVLHTEDQRPFKCTVESCGWSFTTSYKLKRHLQSHDKQRPYTCVFENCGRRFTTVYNLKAHLRGHAQEEAFPCEMCGERFHTATRLATHQRTHFEPERPHKCEFPGKEAQQCNGHKAHSNTVDGSPVHGILLLAQTRIKDENMSNFFACVLFFFPGCEKSFITFSALFSHNRTHFRETSQFICTYPGCDKRYDKACRLKIHLRSHTGSFILYYT